MDADKQYTGPHDAGDAPQDVRNIAKLSAPAWRAYAHLSAPLITVLLFFAFGSTILGPGGPQAHGRNRFFVIIAVATLLTYWLGSLVYPSDLAGTSSGEAVRFTRKNHLYRAAVLFTYRWLYGTPFNFAFFVGDLLLSYAAGALIGERPAGTTQRRSEFFVAVAWAAGNWVLQQITPASLQFYVLVVDRVLWRTAYIALVDDVIGVLSKPDVKTLGGKVTLVLVQGFTVVFVLWMLRSWRKQIIGSPSA